MKLINKYADTQLSKIINNYYCEITSELDKLAELNPNGLWEHYISYDDKDGCLLIKMVDETLGSIEYDGSKLITKIHVCTDYVEKLYPDDVNEQLQKFVGQKIEIGE